MSSSVQTSADVAAPRRRWPRRLLVLLLLAIGLPAAYYFYAETDALDPGWRLADIEAARQTYRDEDNGALQAIKARRLMLKKPAPGYDKNYEAVFRDLPAAVELNVQQTALIRNALELYPDAVVEARKLAEFSGGRYSLTCSTDVFSTLIPDHHEGMGIADVLMHDAMLRARGGDPDAALDSCRAAIGVGRAFGDEVFTIAVPMRINCYDRGIEAAERTLAQGQAKDASLAELQQTLVRERPVLQNCWVQAVRGERAWRFEFISALREGDIRLGDLMVGTLQMKVPLYELVATNFLPEIYTGDYPQQLRHMNELVAAARLPLEQQRERFAALEATVDRTPGRRTELSSILPFLPPDLTKACESHLRGQAQLAAAEAGLAVERYRLAKQRWPASLDEVVKAGLLEAIPSDPLTGQPLRFACLKDGVAVYSPGFDGQDDGGNIDRNNPIRPGVDVGFRLWDPGVRRQPPRPPVALPR
jgi:hypothetical protein